MREKAKREVGSRSLKCAEIHGLVKRKSTLICNSGRQVYHFLGRGREKRPELPVHAYTVNFARNGREKKNTD